MTIAYLYPAGFHIRPSRMKSGLVRSDILISVENTLPLSTAQAVERVDSYVEG
jgi:hypothetical protein